MRVNGLRGDIRTENFVFDLSNLKRKALRRAFLLIMTDGLVPKNTAMLIAAVEALHT